jgi:hypothetical protein
MTITISIIFVACSSSSSTTSFATATAAVMAPPPWLAPYRWGGLWQSQGQPFITQYNLVIKDTTWPTSGAHNVKFTGNWTSIGGPQRGAKGTIESGLLGDDACKRNTRYDRCR